MSTYQGSFEVVNLSTGRISEISLTHTGQSFGPGRLANPTLSRCEGSIRAKWESGEEDADLREVSFINKNTNLIHLPKMNDPIHKQNDGGLLRLDSIKLFPNPADPCPKDKLSQSTQNLEKSNNPIKINREDAENPKSE